MEVIKIRGKFYALDFSPRTGYFIVVERKTNRVLAHTSCMRNETHWTDYDIKRQEVIQLARRFLKDE